MYQRGFKSADQAVYYGNSENLDLLITQIRETVAKAAEIRAGGGKT